jgi:thiol-disulfide isomerase/thioredoxin
MIRRLIAHLLLVSAAVAADPIPASSTLRWQNGEAISGEIGEASADSVSWKTPLFEDPMVVKWSALSRIDRKLPTVASVDPFGIALRDGSYIHGDILSVTDQSVTIKSTRQGEVALRKSEILSIRRHKGGSLIFGGPTGIVGWDILSNRKKASDARKVGAQIFGMGNSPRGVPAPGVPALLNGLAGSLSMPIWNRGGFLDVSLPESVDIEFRVRSSARPDFQLSLEGAPKQRLRVETWDNELVLVSGDQFKSLLKIGDDERDFDLRLLWDRKSGKCLVLTPAGEAVGDWQVPPDPAITTTGLVLQNKGRDLSLTFLKIRTWDGLPPPKVDPTQPMIELTDGRRMEGTLIRGSAEQMTYKSNDAAPEVSVPLSDVESLILSRDLPRVTEHEATFSYADGGILMGSLLAIHDGIADVRATFAETPIASQLDGLQMLRLALPSTDDTPDKRPLSELDRISIQKTTLHGKLASTGDGWPRWLPVGGVSASIPTKAMAVEITRALPAERKEPDAPALFYTNYGDVLAGRLRSIDDTGIEFESSLVEATKLAGNLLNAIQFNPISQSAAVGLSDPAWRILRGDKKTVRISEDSLGMDADTSLAHPALMQCSEIKFLLSYSSSSTVRLKMFCAGTDGARCMNLMLAHWGSRVYSGLESSDGDMDDRVDTSVNPGKPVEVRLSIQEKQVELYLNGSLTQQFPIAAANRAGAGLIIEPAALFGNNVNSISISKFSAISLPGRTLIPDVTPETRLQSLTVPRFRRDDPPRHALLAANGDVLRGEIEAVTESHFGFRSGLENLRVPRDRVKAAIWLGKPREPGEPAAEKSPALKRLDQKISRRVRYSEASLSTLINYLQGEVEGLTIKLPEKQDKRTFEMQFGGQTVGEALGKICSLFGLRYRADGDGTIVLEAGPKTSGDLVQRIYWLPPDAFSDPAAAATKLAEMGITFPSGARALWEPKAGQLSMTNTAAAHEQLRARLAADFAGSFGSPTHWLLLANGARLGLIVDKFEPDSIVGHHPRYGLCKIPVADVFVIRTTMPEPTASMKSLEDWHLVFAREPVLPETGGDSSPTLGTVAKPFKLPLLKGGDFDLGKEKGKVVVLDFWATWCGPCIKSLPGLIQAMSAFPADQVELVGINQGEPPEQVKRFLDTRGWSLSVAMDASQSVARQYGVDGIPHTVIVGPDGKIAWVKTGYSPDGEAEASDAVKQLLSGAAK